MEINLQILRFSVITQTHRVKSNIEFFNDNLTVEAMYDCYFKMIDELDSNASDSI